MPASFLAVHEPENGAGSVQQDSQTGGEKTPYIVLVLNAIPGGECRVDMHQAGPPKDRDFTFIYISYKHTIRVDLQQTRVHLHQTL